MPILRRCGRQPVDALLAEADLAGVELAETRDHAQQRGLAAARRPEQREELAFLRRQATRRRRRAPCRNGRETLAMTMFVIASALIRLAPRGGGGVVIRERGVIVGAAAPVRPDPSAREDTGTSPSRDVRDGASARREQHLRGAILRTSLISSIVLARFSVQPSSSYFEELDVGQPAACRPAGSTDRVAGESAGGRSP